MYGSEGLTLSVTLFTFSQGLSKLRDAVTSFLRSLPRSCLIFLAVSVVASVANCIHGLVVLVVGTNCSAEQAVTSGDSSLAAGRSASAPSSSPASATAPPASSRERGGRTSGARPAAG